MTAGTINKTKPVSFAEVSNIIPNPPTKINRLRSAIETDDPITERISVVSVVIRLRTSPVRIVS